MLTPQFCSAREMREGTRRPALPAAPAGSARARRTATFSGRSRGLQQGELQSHVLMWGGKGHPGGWKERRHSVPGQVDATAASSSHPSVCQTGKAHESTHTASAMTASRYNQCGVATACGSRSRARCASACSISSRDVVLLSRPSTLHGSVGSGRNSGAGGKTGPGPGSAPARWCVSHQAARRMAARRSGGRTLARLAPQG